MRLPSRSNQGLQGPDGDADRSAGEAIEVSGVHSDHFATRIEHRTAAAAVGGGRVIDQLVADDISQVAAGSLRPDQRQRRQFAGRALIVGAIRQAVVNRGWRLGHHSCHPHGIADHRHEFTGSRRGFR